MQTLPPGLRLGPYEVLSLLGAGGFGAVYAARDASGRGCAIKLLHRAEDVALARFDRERRLLEALGDHPGFVTLLDAGFSPYGPYIVLRHLRGGTLAERLRDAPKQRLELAEALRLAGILAASLADIHERGIVHRDLKPENILFDGEAPVIADLGISKARGPDGERLELSLTGDNSHIGTVQYMAPEQMEDAARATAAADVFSFGAILYEALAGRPPFPGANDVEVTMSKVRVRLAPLRSLRREVPPWLAELIHDCLATEPEERPESGRALLARLEPEDAAASRALWLIPLALLAIAPLALLLLLPGEPRAPSEAAPKPVTPDPQSPEARWPEAPLPAPALTDDRWAGYVASFEGEGWELKAVEAEPGGAFARPVTALTVAGELILAGSEGGVIRVWDPGRPGDALVLETGWANGVGAIAAAATGELIASPRGGATARVWRSADGHRIAELRAAAPIHTLLALPSGQVVFVRDGGVERWDPARRQRLSATELGGPPPGAAALAPDGAALVVAGGAGRVSLLRASGELIAQRQGRDLGYTAAVITGANRLALGSADGHIEAWSLEPLALIASRRSEAHDGAPITGLAPLPDGRVVAGGAADGLQAWTLEDPLRAEDHTRSAGATAHIAWLAGKGAIVSAVGDGWLRVVVAPDRILDRRSGFIERPAVFAADTRGRRVVGFTSTGPAQLLDLAAGTRAPAASPQRLLSAAAFSPSGRFLALGDASGALQLRDLDDDTSTTTRATPAPGAVEPGPVSCIAVDDEGQVVAGHANGVMSLARPSGGGVDLASKVTSLPLIAAGSYGGLAVVVGAATGAQMTELSTLRRGGLPLLEPDLRAFNAAVIEATRGFAVIGHRIPGGRVGRGFLAIRPSPGIVVERDARPLMVSAWDGGVVVPWSDGEACVYDLKGAVTSRLRAAPDEPILHALALEGGRELLVVTRRGALLRLRRR